MGLSVWLVLSAEDEHSIGKIILIIVCLDSEISLEAMKMELDIKIQIKDFSLKCIS